MTSLSQVAYFECDHTADIREEILEAVKLPISRPWTRFGTLPEKYVTQRTAHLRMATFTFQTWRSR